MGSAIAERIKSKYNVFVFDIDRNKTKDLKNISVSNTIDELLRLKRIEYFEFSSKKYKNTYNFLAENNPN